MDALEASGWVSRRPHPSDRRATLVELTDRGSAVAGQMEKERGAAARELFGDIEPDDLATFVAIMDRLLASLGDAAVVNEGSRA